MKTYVVVCDFWTESERGWGKRPDGYSYHLSREDYNQYVKEYWEREIEQNDANGGGTPECYSKENGNPQAVDVNEETYEKIKESKNGFRSWDCLHGF